MSVAGQFADVSTVPITETVPKPVRAVAVALSG
jgi:hypothetical protein